MSRAGLWIKLLVAGSVMCIGGPALVYYVTPTEEELFKAGLPPSHPSTHPSTNHQSLTASQRYNPELQKRSLENRIGKQQDFDDFVGKLKEYSKSDKPIWEAAAEAEALQKADKLAEQQRVAAAIQKRRDEIKKKSISPE